MTIGIRSIAALLFAALTAAPAAACAAEGEEDESADDRATDLSSSNPTEEPASAPQPPRPKKEDAPLTQEWVGIEVTPVAMAMPDKPIGREGHVSTFQAGPGGNLRFGRHRWEYVYATPLQVGLFVSTVGTQTIFLHLQTEVGVIVPGTDRRLELGFGGGVGILAMHYATGCDGSCDLGGSGWLLSLAARFLILDGPSPTLGVNVRAVFPQQIPTSEVFGYYVGGGSMMFAGFELGFGRS